MVVLNTLVVYYLVSASKRGIEQLSIQPYNIEEVAN